MLRLKNLGSGSTGNATVVEGHRGQKVRRLLIDCGFGIRQLQTRLALAGLSISDIDAVFITHEHSDHVGCVQSLVLRHGFPVWMSAGTHAALGSPDFGGMLRIARDLQDIDMETFVAQPFTVPHDAREPLQLRCSDGTYRLGVLTDLGHASDHVLEQLTGCHALMVEANHDPDLLASSSYPAFLKRRVGGRFGHLSNAASAELVRAIMHRDLQWVVAAHLSQRNNVPHLAQNALAQAIGWAAQDVVIASPQTGTDWLVVA
jgi:phosphoribosyl 1,2-cyclic phosphodiesterase